jgi:GPH family glycoside/pentoside/hexuronide:cation symporter
MSGREVGLPGGVSLATKLTYGFGTVAYGVKDNGFNYLLLLFYNQVLGLPARLVGLAIMIALIVDGFVDPLIGHLSDHLHSPLGRRHPFMYASALPCAVAYYFLWNPPGGLGDSTLFVYLLITAIVVRVLIACYEIPSAALISELTQDYDQRTSLVAYRFFFGVVGAVFVGVLAFAVYLQPSKTESVGMLNRAGYHGYSIAAALIMFAAIIVSTAGTHRFIPYLRAAPQRRPFNLAAEVKEIRAALSNRGLLAMLGTGCFGSMAAGIVATLSIYFATYFWHLSPNQLSLISLSSLISALIALTLARQLSRRFDKKPAAIGTAIAALILAPSTIILRLLDVFPDNQSPALFPLILGISVIFTTLSILSATLLTSMLADTIEENEIRNRQRSDGLYFAAAFFVQKCVSGLGVFASGLVLSWARFPEGARPDAVAPEVLRNLGALYVLIIVVLYAISIFCATRYRIGRADHAANVLQLQSAGVIAAD